MVCAAADEIRINDLRLEWSSLYRQDVDLTGPFTLDPGTGITDKSQADLQLSGVTRQRVGLGYVRSFNPLEADRGSFLVGGFVIYDRIDAANGTLGQTALGELFGGWAWALTPAWHIEQGLLLGIGESRWHLQSPKAHFDNTDRQASSHGLVYEYGMRLGTTYCWKNVVVGADARYCVSRSSQEFNDVYAVGAVVETSSWKTTVRTDGIIAAVTLGYRF